MATIVASSAQQGVDRDDAIATHVQHDQLHLAAPASAVLCLIWLGAWLRHPEILWSLDRRADDSAGLPVENDVKMAVGISRET